MRHLAAAFLFVFLLAGCAGVVSDGTLTAPDRQLPPAAEEPSEPTQEPLATNTSESVQTATEIPAADMAEPAQPTADAPATDVTESVRPTAQAAQVDCVSGYVLGGGDITPSGLTDAPRSFQYLVQQDNGHEIMVGYMAYPPSPASDKLGPSLSFYGGTIEGGDYLEACGVYDASTNTLTVSEPDHTITTRPGQSGD